MDAPENIKAGLNWKTAVLDWIRQTSAYLKQQRIQGDNRIIFAEHTPNGIILCGDDVSSPIIQNASVRANLDIRYRKIDGQYYVCVFNSNKYQTYPADYRSDEDPEGMGYISTVYGDEPTWMSPEKYSINPSSLSQPLYAFAVMHAATRDSTPAPSIVFSRSHYNIYSHTGPHPSITLLARVKIVNGKLNVYYYVDRHSPIIISRAQYSGLWMPHLFFCGSSLVLEEQTEYLNMKNSGTIVNWEGNSCLLNSLSNEPIVGNCSIEVKFDKKNPVTPSVILNTTGYSLQPTANEFYLTVCKLLFQGNPFVTCITNNELPSVLYDLRDMQRLIKRVEALER